MAEPTTEQLYKAGLQEIGQAEARAEEVHRETDAYMDEEEVALQAAVQKVEAEEESEPTGDDNPAGPDQPAAKQEPKEQEPAQEPDLEAEPEEGDAEPAPLDPVLVSKAKELGFAEDELRDMGEARFLHMLARVTHPQQQPSDTQQKQPQAQPEPQKAALDKQDFDLKLNEEELDPEIVGAFKGITAQLAAMKAEVQTMAQRANAAEAMLRQQEARRFQDWFDSQFDGLGDDLSAEFGKGKMTNIGRPQIEKRLEVVRLMDELSTTRRSLGMPSRGEKAEFDMAMMILHRPVLERQARSELSNETTKRKNMGVSRTTSRKSQRAAPKTMREATAAAAAYAREKGIPVGEIEDGTSQKSYLESLGVDNDF